MLVEWPKTMAYWSVKTEKIPLRS